MNEAVTTIRPNVIPMNADEEKNLDTEASEVELRVRALTVDSDLAYGVAGNC